MDNNIWSIDNHGFYVYHDDIFDLDTKFAPSSIVNYVVDTNSKLLIFASKMKQYFEIHNAYPQISFDDWLKKEADAVDSIREEVSFDYRFFNEADEDKAVDLLIQKYEYDSAHGKAPDCLDSYHYITKDYIKYIFNNAIEWARGMYGC